MSVDPFSMADKAILVEIGSRIATARLNQNITQESMAERTGVSVETIRRMEKNGSGKVSTLVAILRELQALDQLELMLPEDTIDPIALAEMQGKTRQRARGGK